jgi:hypothetical protein
MVKALGKEIIDFYFDESEPYDDHDYLEIDIDEITDIDPKVKYELKYFGFLLVPHSEKWVTFQSAFIKWRRKQSHESFLITVAKEDVEKVKYILKQFKGIKIE